MRKIDTAAYNKRLHSEILKLSEMLEKITPENIKYFDTNLIKNAENYVGLLKEMRWASNSNFNSIELGKIKQLLNYIRISRNRLFVDREFNIMKTGEFERTRVGTNVYRVPDNYDGRSSFVYPRIFVQTTDNNGNITGGYMNPLDIFLCGMTYISDDYDVVTMPEIGSTKSRLEIVKNKHEITIHYEINTANTITYDYGAGTDTVTDSTVSDSYLDVLYVIWRKR